MFRPDHHHLRRDFSPPDSTSSSSFLIPFDSSTTPTTTTNTTTTWNPNLFPSPDLHFPSFPFSPFSLHDEISHLLPPPPDELLLLPSSYISTPPSVWTPRSRPDASTLALSLASSNPPNRWLPVQAIPAAGPLGPFTGYAAILKNSKFLRPAQQLLDEFCHAVTGSRPGRVFDAGSSSSSDPPDPGYAAGGRKIHQRPEFEHLKNKLLYMQEEVCKRYKQYHQQMQMVVSSFETVAGLSSATPYTTLALKAVSKHFRSLKSAISDQLRHVCNVLGEELMASSPTSCKNDSVAFPKLKYGDPNLRRQKSNDGSLGFSDNSHPVWRPQRGLPERAVSVLRAWLFDHFLHPYPTDTDKHMLATQTGLSRNQVSNWFINARVRLWKPMVEEIHSLETKGMAGMDLNSSIKGLDKSVVDQRSDGQLSRQADGSESGELIIEKSARCAEPWHPDKRSRMEECAMDAAGLMSFAYQGAMDIGGLGAVSLTLGLRQGEGLQQHQEEEQQLRRFGHQMLHDFVG